MRLRYCVLLIVPLLFLQAGLLHAQGVQWEERHTLLFTILYPTGAKATADQYAGFVDSIYDEESAFWDFRPVSPIVLRLYPTMDLYYQANPLATKIPGVIAHAHTGRREISVAIPQTASETPDEIRNNIRHELTHIIAADLSNGRLTTPWQEGIAQYAEHPSQQLEAKMQLMRQIVAENRLLSWADLNQPGITYSDPRIGYPESLTIVAFLVHRNGMQRFRFFVEAMKDASGYLGALESVYQVPAADLEREWRAQLPDFISTGYRSAQGASNTGAPTDFAEPERMVARGDFSGAIRKVQPMIDALRSSGDGASIARGQSLLARAEAGQRAIQMAGDARAALVRGDYQAAAAAGESGQKQLAALGLTDKAAATEEYASLAGRGLEAEEKAAAAGDLLRHLQIRAAHQQLLEAYTTFEELGDDARAAQARQALDLIVRGERVLAAICLICGTLLIAWSGRRRFKERRVALPFT